MPKRVLILTRDGVLITDRTPSGADPIIAHGALEAVSRLSHAGFHVVVLVTRKLGADFTLADQNALHVELQRRASEAGGHIDGFFFCPHNDHNNCHCAPPDTGLLEDIAERWRIHLRNVTVVCSDHEGLTASAKAGAVPVLVDAAFAAGDAPRAPGIEGYATLAAFAEARIREESA